MPGKEDLVHLIATKTGHTPEVVSSVLSALPDAVLSLLRKHKTVRLPSIAVIEVASTPDKTKVGRPPRPDVKIRPTATFKKNATK